MKSEEPTVFKVRVTGHLWLNGIEVDTVHTTFTVTVTEATETSSEDSDASTAASAESCAISFTTAIKEEGFPTFELAQVTDPSTGQPVSYTVTIPDKIKGIFVYEESDLLIYSKLDTRTAGITGFHTIDVTATCNEEE